MCAYTASSSEKMESLLLLLLETAFLLEALVGRC